MKVVFTTSLGLVFTALSIAQDEVVSPLLTNPHAPQKQMQQRVGNDIDSTFIYNIDTLTLPVWDDFSINKFIPYDADFTDGNVSSVLYYQLMNSTNTVHYPAGTIFCDSTRARIDTVSVVSGIATTTSDYFPTVQSVWVNDLNTYPVEHITLNLYQECYVIIDSLVDGVWDDDRDTIFYITSPHYEQDSARVFFVDYTDPNAIWIDTYAYHNYRYAVDPWSLGVATFDGVDENGWPYDWGNTNAHEPADVLTSRPINLAGKTNVWLTFIYQAEGRGNAPESNDTLMLDWWLPDSNAWYPSQWYVVGGDIPVDTWDTVHWAVTSAAFDNGFRFRFRNWASTSGNLDHWHIDYVNLKDNDLPTTSNFSDLAISEPINSILDTYTAVPWDHFKNANAGEKMLDELKVRVYNSNNTPTNYANGGLEIAYGGILQGGSPYILGNPGISGDWTGNWELGMNKYPYDLDANYVINAGVAPGAQAAFDVKLNIDAAVSGSNVYDVNDTTYHVQDFRNYYSYDDGSAEAAYGITGSHSLLAYKFDAYEEDTLTGVLMHWVPSVDDHSDQTFLLTIWSDNAGKPGAIIYQDDYFNTQSPEYSGGINGYRYYTFMGEQHVKVPQTFYVGWEQIGSVSMNLGLDRNIDNSDKIFLNTNGTWINSSNDASLMIRPVFSTSLNYTLGNGNQSLKEEEKTAVLIYPNPAKELINIQINATDFTVNLYDLTGRIVSTVFNEYQIDIADLQTGIYVVDIRDTNGVSLYSGKLIKE